MGVAEIVSFEIPESLAQDIRNNAFPQSQTKNYLNSPQISDPRQSTGAYGLHKEYIDKVR